MTERYVVNRQCVICAALFQEGRLSVPERHSDYKWPRPGKKINVTWDFNHLTEAQKAIWYMRVDVIKNGKQKKHRHHPLDEPAILIALRGI